VKGAPGLSGQGPRGPPGPPGYPGAVGPRGDSGVTGEIRTCVLKIFYLSLFKTRNTFCGTWYLPHSRVYKSMIELCA